MTDKRTIIELKHSSGKSEKQIVAIAKELYPKYTKGICHDWLRKILRNKYQKLLVAKNNSGYIIGMLTLTVYPTIGGFSKAWIEDFAVLKNYQGKGIGNKLLKFTINLAKSSNINVIFLTSRSERKAANHLYNKLNFEAVKTNLYKIDLLKN